MRIEHEVSERGILVRLAGELDVASADAFRNTADRLLAATGSMRLFLNLEGVTFIDSSGLGAILGRYKRISQMNGRMGIIGAAPQVRTILELSGILKIIPLFDSEARALESR